jgi:type I restriction enzyme, R subunit
VLTEADIQALAHTLNQADLFITVESLRQAYHQPEADLEDFLRYILGLSDLPSHEEQISAAFDAFIAEHPQFSARQITFLRVVRSQVLRRAHLSNEDFARPPFTRVGRAGTMFSPDELDEIITFADQFVEDTR